MQKQNAKLTPLVPVANAGNHVPATMVFIEDQPNVQGTGPISLLDSLTGSTSDYGTTHSITLLADSLAANDATRNAWRAAA